MRARIEKGKRVWLAWYEKDYKNTIKDLTFKPGDLVLIRNMEIELSLDKKMKLRYTGPMIVVLRMCGGSYVLAELDGAVLHQRVGVFRVIPYFARTTIELPKNIHDLLDILKSGLQRIEDLEKVDAELPGQDFSFDNVRLRVDDEEFEDGECVEDVQNLDTDIDS